MANDLGINLLRKRHALSEKEYLKEREIYHYSLSLLVVGVVVSMTSLFYQVMLAGKLKKIENGIASSTSELVGYTDASAQQIYLKSRLKLIGSFLANRSISRSVIEQIFSISLPGVVISEMSFESDELLNVQFTTDNVVVFGDLLKYLSENIGFFSQVVSRGVTRTAEGQYQMQTLLTIPRNL